MNGHDHYRFFNSMRPEFTSRFSAYVVERPDTGRSFECDTTRVKFLLVEGDVKYGVIFEFENRRTIKPTHTHKLITDVAWWYLTDVAKAPDPMFGHVERRCPPKSSYGSCMVFAFEDVLAWYLQRPK